MEQNLRVDARDCMKALESMEFAKAVSLKDRKRIFRQSANIIKKSLTSGAKSVMRSDPRQAYKAIRIGLYKTGTGALISITNSKKASSFRTNIVRNVSGITRNRKRSDATNRIDGYWGKDRSFILRFFNAGAIRRGRGIIPRTDFFRTSVISSQSSAQDTLVQNITDSIQQSATKVGL